jgi:hypothetical protein
VVAPVAAWVVKVLPPRTLGTFVGGLIVVLNARTILLALDVPGAPRLAVLVGLAAVGASMIVRAHLIAREEAALAALVPEPATA